MQKRPCQTFWVSVSRNDGVMRNNLCGGIALGLILVPSHPPARALCVFSRCVVVSLLWRVCLCFSRWSGERVRLGVCQRCLDLWSTIGGLVQCPLGFYKSFGFLSSSRSLQVYSWPCSACCSFVGWQLRLLCDVLRGMYLFLASVCANLWWWWLGFRGISHVGPVFRWYVVLESLLTI